jgi:hypothetical protein
MKFPLTPLEIAPMTVWLVVISLNQLRHHVPQEVSVYTGVIILYWSYHNNVDEIQVLCDTIPCQSVNGYRCLLWDCWHHLWGLCRLRKLYLHPQDGVRKLSRNIGNYLFYLQVKDHSHIFYYFTSKSPWMRSRRNVLLAYTTVSKTNGLCCYFNTLLNLQH